MTEQVTAALPAAQQAWVQAVNTGAIYQTGDGVANIGVVMGDVRPGR